jgi:hypothetical protein
MIKPIIMYAEFDRTEDLDRPGNLSFCNQEFETLKF